MLRRMAALTVLVLFCACGADSRGENASTSAEIAQLESELSSSAAGLAAATRVGKEAAEDRDTAQARLAEVRSESAELATQLNRMESDLAQAEAEVERLRETYDPQIQADREAEEQRKAEERAAADAATVERARLANLSAMERLEEECFVINPDQLQRDPDATVGVCYVMITHVTQWDGATGPCVFRANYDVTTRDHAFEYAGDSGIFVASQPCAFLDGMDVGDTIKIWAENNGTLTYDTAIGGSNTTVEFDVKGAQLLIKG